MTNVNVNNVNNNWYGGNINIKGKLPALKLTVNRSISIDIDRVDKI